jgi:hypothetical protein
MGLAVRVLISLPHLTAAVTVRHKRLGGGCSPGGCTARVRPPGSPGAQTRPPGGAGARPPTARERGPAIAARAWPRWRGDPRSCTSHDGATPITGLAPGRRPLCGPVSGVGAFLQTQWPAQAEPRGCGHLQREGVARGGNGS